MKYFKYFDPDLAEAITLTGQFALKTAMRSVNEFLNKALKTVGIEYAFYGDTDSVVGDTLIYVDGEKMKISDLYDKFENYSQYDETRQNFVKPANGETTLSFNEEARKIEEKPIKYVMKHKVKKRMFKIKVENKEVIVTEDHSVIVNREGRYLSLRPSEIKNGDKIIQADTDSSVENK